MRKRVEQLPLVFVNAFDLAVEDRVGVDRRPAVELEPIRELRLRLAFGRAERRRESLRRRRAARASRSWPSR